MSGNNILQQNNTPTKYNRIISWLTGLLTLVLAGFAFVLSFNALTDLAQKHGVSIPPLFPFVVEFSVVIFSLNALHRSLTGQKAIWQWTLIIFSSLLAGTFNVAHAQDDILSRTMAAMPSLFLLLSFESFLSLVRYSVTRQSAIVTLDDIQKKIATKRGEYDKLAGQIDKAELKLKTLDDDISTDMSDIRDKAQQAKQEKVTERRTQVLELLQAGKGQDDIAQELNVSIRTIARDIKSLNGKAVSL